MCGIIGYIGDKEIVPLLVNGLKKLQYRGYDSAGICIIDSNKNLICQKQKGKLQELEEQIIDKTINGKIGIAHTRWATHGEPSQTNAHPHLDCKSNIAIVHNGIIENHNTLKKMLIKEGHIFVSNTDSEVIAHLIEKFYENNLEEALVKTLGVIEGAYGIAVIHKEKNEIVAAKKGSPLIIGVGENEMFVCSDVAAILEHTKKVIYLDDNEIAIINQNNFSIKNLNKEEIGKKIHEIKWTIEEIEKGGYKHFMLKEIFEQSEAISNVLRGRIRNGKIKISNNINPSSIKRIIILACGTSWHAGLIGKYIIEKLTRIPVEVDYASEFRYRNPILKEDDLVMAISQSGETADTLAAIKEAKNKSAKTFGIINVVNSSIAREVGSGIYLHAGPEIGVASTKAFSCQIMALILFSLYIKQSKNEEIDEELLKEINLFPDKVKLILNSFLGIKNIAEKYSQYTSFLYLGRGINYPVALEGALKLKEISYIHAEGYPAAEMKHGPIALIDDKMPSIFIATKGDGFEKTLNNIEEVKARNGKIICITDELDDKLKTLCEDLIIVPKTIDILSPILNNIPLQLLAYYIADKKAIDVDKPRNLAKSVTVE